MRCARSWFLLGRHASGSFVRALDRRSPAFVGQPFGVAAAAERLDRIGLDADLGPQARNRGAYIGLERLEEHAMCAEDVASALRCGEP